MYFSTFMLLVPFAVLSLAMPIRKPTDLLQAQEYLQFQISDGVAGNALEEIATKFPVEELRADFARVSDNDLSILKAARDTAEAAEIGAGGFNEIIEQVGDESDDGQALAVGKVKNRILKLELEYLALQIEQARGLVNQTAVDDIEQRLAVEVANDKDRAGDQSQSINFAGSSEP